MEGKGGMPSLRETLAGHLRGGHEIVLVVPKYHLFSETLERINVREDQGYDVYVAPCEWVRLIKSLQFVARRIGGGRMPYVARWIVNLLVTVLLTASLYVAARKLMRRQRVRFDMVYAHNKYAAIAGLLIRWVAGIPNVTRLYGTFLADLMKRPLVWLRYPSASAGYLVPHRLLICANDGTRGDEVARKFGIDLDRFRFWQNGVDLPDAPPDSSRDDLVAQFGDLGLRSESKWIISCSRLSYWKRIDRMLRAVAYCRQHGCDCQLLVAGDGPESDALLALAMELGINDAVVWLGAVAHDDIWALMNVADVFMITNDVTNRCNPVYEAMCAGLPAVSVRDPSTADLLEHQVNALLADKDDSEELGRCVLRAFDDDELLATMGQAQRDRAESLWTWTERMAEEVRELEAIVAESRPRRQRVRCAT